MMMMKTNIWMYTFKWLCNFVLFDTNSSKRGSSTWETRLFSAGWVPHLISQPEVLEAIIYLFGWKGIRRKFQRCILTITLFDRWPTSIKEHCTQHLLAPYNQPQSAGKGQPRSWSPSLCFPQSPPLPLLSQMSSLRYLESTHKYLKITLKHLRVTHKYWSNNYANL